MKFTAKDLQFQDDEETTFGNTPDYSMKYSSGNDQMEITDKANSTNPHIPRGRLASDPNV